MEELENYMHHYALLTAKQSTLATTRQHNHHSDQLLEVPSNVLEITIEGYQEVAGHKQEERLPGTKEHFRNLKAIVVKTYKNSKYSKPVAAVQAALFALGYGFAMAILRTDDSCRNIKDWLEEDPDKMKNHF